MISSGYSIHPKQTDNQKLIVCAKIILHQTIPSIIIKMFRVDINVSIQSQVNITI